MGSQAQAEASRINGAKSNGPVTDAGKERSSRNATKHGLSAGRFILLDQEDLEQFRLYRESFWEDLDPHGAMEEELVERIVISSWRLRRAARLEADMMDADLAAALEDRAFLHRGSGRDKLPESLRSWEVGRRFKQAFGVPCSSYDGLGRYERRIERGLFQAIKELRSLQKDRGATDECGCRRHAGNQYG